MKAGKKIPVLLRWAFISVFGCLPCIAAPGGDLPLPDRVVVKPGTALPPGVAGPEISCVILEENEKELRLDLSKFRGIQQLWSVERAQVVRLQRGDASLRPWFELGKILQWPAHSREAAYYEPPLKGLAQFLEKYPGSAHAPEARKSLGQWQEEWQRVRQGDFRVRDRWFKPAELAKTDQRAWSYWKALPAEAAPAELEDWAALVADLRTHHASQLYPAIHDEVRRLVALRRAQFSAGFHADKADWAVLEEPMEPLWKVWSTLAEWDPAPFDPLAPPGPLLNVLQSARGVWADLEWIDALLDRCLSQVRERLDGLVRAGNWDEAGRLVASWDKAPAIFREGTPSRSATVKWLAEVKEEIENGRELGLLEKNLTDRDWAEVERRSADLLRRPGVQEGFIHTRVLEIQKIYKEWQASEEAEAFARLISGGKYREVLERARGQRLKMEGEGDTWEVLQQQQADILVEVAQKALLDYQPWMAWRLVLEAWRTKPGNVKAQIAVTLGAAGGFLILLLAAIPALLIYALLSKNIENFYFSKRLRMAKAEEERHLRRQREAAEKSKADTDDVSE